MFAQSLWLDSWQSPNIFNMQSVALDVFLYFNYYNKYIPLETGKQFYLFLLLQLLKYWNVVVLLYPPWIKLRSVEQWKELKAATVTAASIWYCSHRWLQSVNLPCKVILGGHLLHRQKFSFEVFQPIAKSAFNNSLMVWSVCSFSLTPYRTLRVGWRAGISPIDHVKLAAGTAVSPDIGT